MGSALSPCATTFWLERVPNLPHNPHNPEDVNSSANDHTCDATFYQITGAAHGHVCHEYLARYWHPCHLRFKRFASPYNPVLALQLFNT